MPLRVVIDPNVWIAALINPYGAPARVIDAVSEGSIVAMVTQQLLDELEAVLVRQKFRRWFSIDEAETLIEALRGHAELRPDPGPPSGRVRDPDDDYLVALAEATGAVIVTGDADLLDADLMPPAITPADLLARLT